MDYCYNLYYSIIIFIYSQYYYNTINHNFIESITPLPHRYRVESVRAVLSRWAGLVSLGGSIYYIYTIRYNTIAYIRLTIDPSLPYRLYDSPYTITKKQRQVQAVALSPALLYIHTHQKALLVNKTMLVFRHQLPR